jgi:hypothetical protein
LNAGVLAIAGQLQIEFLRYHFLPLHRFPPEQQPCPVGVDQPEAVQEAIYQILFTP